MMELLDLREEALETLPERVKEAWAAPGCLILSRRPSKNWVESLEFAHPLRLSSAPLYELILWLEPSQLGALPEEVRVDQRELLDGYHRLFREEGDLEAYLSRLTEHIRSQEKELFPSVAALAPVERALRELSYEHRGLEKGALRLREAVAQHRRGELEKKDKDRLDLDFYHLLEHHIERERDALYPACSFLQINSKKG